MKNNIIKIILIIVIIICSIYTAIELTRGIAGMDPLIILKTEKNITYERESTETKKVFKFLEDRRGRVTEITYGLIFSNYVSYSTGLSTGSVHRENRLFNLIPIWEMTAE